MHTWNGSCQECNYETFERFSENSLSNIEVEALEHMNQSCSRRSLDCTIGKMYFDAKWDRCFECPRKTRPDVHRRGCLWDECSDVRFLDEDGYCKLPICTQASSRKPEPVDETDSPRGSMANPSLLCFRQCPEGYHAREEVCVNDIY